MRFCSLSVEASLENAFCNLRRLLGDDANPAEQMCLSLQVPVEQLV